MDYKQRLADLKAEKEYVYSHFGYWGKISPESYAELQFHKEYFGATYEKGYCKYHHNGNADDYIDFLRSAIRNTYYRLNQERFKKFQKTS